MPSQDLVVKLKAENAELKSRVKESERALKDFQKAAQDAAKQSNNQGWSKMLTNLTGIKTGAGGASGGLGLMTGALGKLAGGLGVALSAAELFNRAVDNSNSLGDEFEKIQTQASNAVNYFANCLATCNFSGFISGIMNAWEAGGKFADILDEISTRMQILGVVQSDYDKKIAQLRLQRAGVRNGTKEAEELDKQILDMTNEKADTYKEQALQERKKAIAYIDNALGGKGQKAATTGEMDRVIYGEFDQKALDAADAFKRLDEARKVLATGYAYGLDERGLKRAEQEVKLAEARTKAYEKEGYTRARAEREVTLKDLADNGENAPVTRARQAQIAANQAEVRALDEKAGITRRLVKDQAALEKSEKSAHKAYLAELKKTYNGQARSVFGIQANITALTELQDKADPLSDKFKEIGEEIQDWKDKLDNINISRLEPGSMGRMNAELSKWTAVRDRSAMDSKSYQDADYHVRQLADAIQKANEKQNELMRPTDKEWQSKAYNDIIKQVRWLQQELNKIDWTINPDQYNAVKDQLKAAQDELQGPPPLKDSIEAVTRALQDLEEQYNKTGDAAKRSAIKQRMAAMEKKLEKAQKGYALDDVFTKQPTQKNQQALESYDAAAQRVDIIMQQVEIGVMGGKEARAQIDEINKALEKLGAEPIEIKILTPGMKKALQNVNLAADAMSSLGMAFSSMSQMAEDDAGLAVAGIIAESIANVALGASQATVAAAQTGNPWVWAAFGVAAMAQMAAMIAQIHSATAMATGGIVPGSSYSGDQINARLNSGEMVLNRRQQTHLFDALDSGRIGGGSETIDVEWRLRGKDLYGSVRNYSKVAGKAGRRTGIR